MNVLAIIGRRSLLTWCGRHEVHDADRTRALRSHNMRVSSLRAIAERGFCGLRKNVRRGLSTRITNCG